MDDEKNKISTEKFVEENKIYLTIFIIILVLFAFNKYDKANRGTIEINLENNVAREIIEDDYMKTVEVLIYDTEQKHLQVKEIKIPKDKNFVGDYVKGIIENSAFTNEDMKFLSAYTLDLDGTKTMLIKLSSGFLDLKDNKEVYRGFVESVRYTIIGYDSSIENVEIQIDGDKSIR